MSHESQAQSQGSASSTSLPAAINTPVKTMDAARASRPGVSMTDRVRPRPQGITYRPDLSAPMRARPESEDDVLGLLWEVAPKTAHQLKLHACRRAADVVNTRRTKGDIEGACSYALPMEHALAALACPDAKHREAVTDATEDVLQAEADRAPSEATVRALARYRATMRQASLDDDRRRFAELGLSW